MNMYMQLSIKSSTHKQILTHVLFSLKLLGLLSNFQELISFGSESELTRYVMEQNEYPYGQYNSTVLVKCKLTVPQNLILKT